MTAPQWLAVIYSFGFVLSWAAGKEYLWDCVLWPIYPVVRIFSLIWFLWCYMIQAPKPFQKSSTKAFHHD